MERVTSCSQKHDTGRFWSLLRSLSGKKPSHTPNQPISFGPRTLTAKPSIARAFCNQFTKVPHFHRNPQSRHLRRSLRSAHPLDPDHRPFSPDLVRAAIAASGTSRAPGPDHLTIHHLKNLGPNGISFLCQLFNISIATATVPSIWKTANIIAIPKPNKPQSNSSSYWPISLLSPAAKVLERLLLPDLNEHLSLSESQHGFRPQRSTTTALLPLTHTIAKGFNQRLPPDRTVAVAVDFSKAFDTVPHDGLLQMLSDTTLPHNLVRWLSSYLRGRQAFCTYEGRRSGCRPVLAGVPQGSVISPALFNYFVSDYPSTAEASSYADDFTAMAAARCPHEAGEALTSHMSDVSTWSENKSLTISAPKSHATLFTPDTHQSHLDPAVSIANQPLPLCRNPNILGVTFDPHFTFAAHATNTANRARTRLNILRALAGTSWGQSKETITTTYKLLISSIIHYAAPIWFPNCKTVIAKLQPIQNSALKIATGNHKIASQSHIHAETSILPLSSSLTMRCRQFLASALQPNHPSHPIVTADSGPRTMKFTLQTKYASSLAHLTTEGIINPTNHQLGLSELHTQIVTEAIDSALPNRVLGTLPPAIDSSDTNLPRLQRSVLSQLRSGYCARLGDYQHRVGSCLLYTSPSPRDKRQPRMPSSA